MCRFDPATYGTATIDVHMNVTREKKYGKYKGTYSRACLRDCSRISSILLSQHGAWLFPLRSSC
jgi:hypothetical protein